jgi:lysophospholipase L1-like esterase
VTGAWSTAYLAALGGPDDTLPFFPSPRRFAEQTVRQRIRLRRGGGAARLVLSNEFGRGPLIIDAITMSDGVDSAAVLPVLRHGAEKWEIPAGATATSDPVPLTTLALTNTGGELVVSCFISASSDSAACLHSAQQTGEIAPGNQLGQRRLKDADQFTALYWISVVLVDQPATRPVVVALGDSITRGDGTTTDHDQRYPDHLQRRLLAADLDGAVVLNAGIGGNRLLTPIVGPSMTDRFDRDVLGVTEATHVLILAGTNDIALSALLGEKRPTADDIIDGLRALARRAARRGVQPVLGTITPFGGASLEAFLTDGNEDIRRAVNDAISAQTDWPVVDFAAALADPGDPTRLATAFDSGDGIHPADAGARALADAIDLGTFR